MKTLEEIANIYNECEELDVKKLENIITENGYTSDCHTDWGICHSDTEKVILNDEGTAIVVPL